MKLDPDMHIGMHLVSFGKSGVTWWDPKRKPQLRHRCHQSSFIASSTPQWRRHCQARAPLRARRLKGTLVSGNTTLRWTCYSRQPCPLWPPQAHLQPSIARLRSSSLGCTIRAWWNASKVCSCFLLTNCYVFVLWFGGQYVHYCVIFFNLICLGATLVWHVYPIFIKWANKILGSMVGITCS
jgi:hypothetical protein